MLKILGKLPTDTNKIVSKILISIYKIAYFFKNGIKNHKNVKINYYNSFKFSTFVLQTQTKT
jgi:hypothetical protein